MQLILMLLPVRQARPQVGRRTLERGEGREKRRCRWCTPVGSAPNPLGRLPGLTSARGAGAAPAAIASVVYPHELAGHLGGSLSDLGMIDCAGEGAVHFSDLSHSAHYAPQTIEKLSSL
jgi:hypothetical protein